MNAEVVLDRLVLGESPRWHDGRLWVADWAAHELITLDASGTRQVVEHPTSIPCCIDWLPDGQLLLVSGDRLLRREPDGTMVTHAELAQLDPHPWNDIAVDSQGNVFVGCIAFDFPAGEFAPGIIAVVTPDGVARTAAKDLAFPNGMVVTPDDATLIVAESYGNRLTAFDIGADGALSNRRVWADLARIIPTGSAWTPRVRCGRREMNHSPTEAVPCSGAVSASPGDRGRSPAASIGSAVRHLEEARCRFMLSCCEDQPVSAARGCSQSF